MSIFVPISNQELEAFRPTIQKIAEAVRDNTISATSKRVSITGPLASIGEQQHSLFLSSGTQYLYQSESNKHSFICNGLTQTKLYIKGKINHLMVRGCQNVHIIVQEGVISGISILGGHGIVIEVPLQNTTSLEETSETVVNGLVTADTIILVSSSMDISINRERLPINFFQKGIVTQGKFYPTEYLPPELQTLLE